jgi:hypothetical protein
MAKRDGKQDLNNNDDEGPMPKKSLFKALNDADSILRILWYKRILKKA